MKISKVIKGAAVVGGALFVAKGIDNRLETTHYSISSKKVPKEFDNFRIVQISDLHSCSVPGLVAEVTNENPDLIVYTGDMAHDYGSYEPTIRLTKQLSKLAPIYSVSGNHDVRRPDYKEYIGALHKAGVVTLSDSSQNIARGGKELTISGIDDPFSEDGNKITHNILNSVSKLNPTDNYHIALFHRANHLNILKNKGFDLILSGHMHGGQIRLPNGRGVCAPKSSWGLDTPMLFPKYFGGHYKSDTTDMIVNRGIGNPMIIPRLFNRPELSVIILKSLEK